MAFNCAIFYDVENLLKGYSFSSQLLNNLSLREILEAVQATGDVSGIAVQRAYANWSDPRLAVMRGEISELGIDPVQVFGFSRDQKKNAADIQLVVDAVDLAHVRPAIEVFVIVSGDGGFAALAKKLHEYGKTVIGCAYPSAANRVLRSVCDTFIEIPDPEETREPTTHAAPIMAEKPLKKNTLENGKTKSAPESPKSKPTTTAQPQESPPATPANLPTPALNPLLRSMSEALPKQKPHNREDMRNIARKVLLWLAGKQAAQLNRGLPLGMLGEALRLTMADFTPERAGFSKLAEFLQWACSETKLQVARMPGGDSSVVLRTAIPAHAVLLPDLDDHYLHSVAHYRACLRTGQPIFRLPDLEALSLVGASLLEEKPDPLELGLLIEMVTARCGTGDLSSEIVKRVLLCFHSAGLFVKEPEGAPLAVQRLSLRPELTCPEELVSLVRQAAHAKLATALDRVDEGVFENLLAMPE